MKLENVFKALEGYQKGSFIRVGWKSNIGNATAKKQGVEVLKVSEATVRIGINYSNIHSVKVAKTNKEGESKPYTVWFKHLDQLPAIIEHLKDTDKKYLQLFTVNKNSYPAVTYLVNGEAKTKKDLLESGLVNASNFEKNETVTFNIPIENLRFIGNYN